MADSLCGKYASESHPQCQSQDNLANFFLALDASEGKTIFQLDGVIGLSPSGRKETKSYLEYIKDLGYID